MPIAVRSGTNTASTGPFYPGSFDLVSFQSANMSVQIREIGTANMLYCHCKGLSPDGYFQNNEPKLLKVHAT